MKRLALISVCIAVWSLAAAAQPAPVPPKPVAAEGQTIAPKKPSCEEQRRKGRWGMYFDKVEIEKLVQTVADVTCKTFILPENIRGKISIIGPENAKLEVNADTFYAAFLAALDANSLAVYEQGKFLKIVDKQRAKQFTIPTIVDSDEPYTTNEQMVTRVFKIKNVEIEQLRGVMQQLVTPSGDTIPFQPDTIIVNDLGSNMHRLEKLVDQLDTRAGADEVRAWTIVNGYKAPQAAGAIHTDFERGFIKAETYHFNDLMEFKSEQAVKDAGKLRIEGKEYVVKDGDIMHFRFNV